MTDPQNNPHLWNEVAHSGDILFKRWFVGVALVLLAFGLGCYDIVTAQASIPLGKPAQWTPIHGISAVCFGISKVGIGLFLHGRYFWRFSNRFWRYYEVLMTFGLAVAVLGWACTIIFVLAKSF